VGCRLPLCGGVLASSLPGGWVPQLTQEGQGWGRGGLGCLWGQGRNMSVWLSVGKPVEMNNRREYHRIIKVGKDF